MNLLTLFRGATVRSSRSTVAALALSAAAFLQAAAEMRADGAVLIGTSVTFVATADGSPTPTFQWQKNGTPIPGATGSIFSINSASLSDAATYQVVATNDSGSAVSPDEVLTVLATGIAPVVTTQPAVSQSAAAGGTLTLTVAASGTPTPTYQWQKNGVLMAGVTSATITLAGVTSNDTGSYVAIATNVAGSVNSNAALVTITDPVVTNPPPPTPPANVAPVITSQPTVSQSVTTGASISLSVAASGTPTPTFQWRKNGSPISGATNATLTLNGVTTTDSGGYMAVATNAAGSATSNVSTVTVTAPVVVAPPPVTPPAVTPPPVVTPPFTPPPSTPSTGNTLPTISTQPVASQTVTAGSYVSLSVQVSGSPTPTLQWRKNGINIAGATGPTLTLNSVSAADAATYTVTATNSVGMAVSNNSILAVNVGPTFTTQPTTQAVALGATARFNVGVSAIPGATLQWRRNGVTLPGATSSTLVIASTSASDLGTYSVVATNSLGSATSADAALVIAAPPAITSQPASQSVSVKDNVTFTVAATGSPEPTYQWKKNGANIAGATAATLSLKSVAISDAGTYTVDVSNVVGWLSSANASLTVSNTPGRSPSDGDTGATPPAPGAASTSNLVNLSVRATAGNGSNALIVGFVINGTAPKPVLVRGVGPTLRDFGVTSVLGDPKLALYTGTAVTAANDDWMSNDNAAQIVSTSARVGAFSLPDRASDSALMATLDSGAYTVQLSGKDSASGVALVEVYDAGTTSSAKLVNLSVRAYIGTGADVPNVGFVIAGNTPKRVMIRAVGPTLSAFGVADAIADPQLELFKGGARINQNDNWGGSAALSATFSQVGAFGFADANSRDAVLLVTLDPGAYTVLASGANGSAGVGLIELYEVP